MLSRYSNSSFHANFTCKSDIAFGERSILRKCCPCKQKEDCNSLSGNFLDIATAARQVVDHVSIAVVDL